VVATPAPIHDKSEQVGRLGAPERAPTKQVVHPPLPPDRPGRAPAGTDAFARVVRSAMRPSSSGSGAHEAGRVRGLVQGA
jgi:hypothetical protein